MFERLRVCGQKYFFDGEPNRLVEIGHLTGFELAGFFLFLKDLVNLFLLFRYHLLICFKKEEYFSKLLIIIWTSQMLSSHLYDRS